MKKKILSIAIPAALGNLLDTLQLLIDMLMIGRLSPSAIAGVGLGGQLIILIYSFISIFYVGTNVIVSRAYGEGNTEKAGKVISGLIVVAVIFSLPFLFFTVYHPDIFFQIMGAEKDVVRQGHTYVSIIGLTMPFLFAGAVIHSAIVATGDTRTPLYISIFTNSLNTVLNYCLIFGNFGFPRLEVQGAAIATSISYTIEVLIFLAVLITGRYGFRLSLKTSIEETIKALKIGIPAGLEKFISFGSFLIFVKIVALYGTATLAGYQIGLRIEGIAFMPGFGFATAAMVLTGQYIGMKKPNLAEKSTIETLKIAMGFMGITGVLFIAFPEQLVSLFTDDRETIEKGALYLRIVGISQIPLAVEFVLNGALRGAGATRTTLLINSLSFWAFRIIPSYMATKLSDSIVPVYIIMTVETFIKAGILWVVYKKGKWKKIKI
ncbi:MATE family efflux transporter [Persephonella sp.]